MICFMQAPAQAVLNEVYTIPGSARQEFFEFYNVGTVTLSMDHYTIVTYFEEGTKKGFYVHDLPDMPLAPMGYFVGSSAVPFNYQGISNSTSSQYSWNDIAFMAANSAYMKKWTVGNTVPGAIDGNDFYDLQPIAPAFNDFFSKIGGSGATYNVFVYHNGVLKEAFLGGTGGSTFLPTYILSLPKLYVDMAGTAPDFEIDFSTYANVNPEYVIQDVGSDNGYVRLRDGYCGLWTKSSSQVTHSPGITNNGNSTTELSELSVSSTIVRGNATTGSTINYDVVAGPGTEFPVTINLYIDNGTVPGQLDAGDTFLDQRIEQAVGEGPYNTVFFPHDANILIQSISSAGCIDNLRFIPNTGVLPVEFVDIRGVESGSVNLLRWTVTGNEPGIAFIVEKSVDGMQFNPVAEVPATAASGAAHYQYTDAAPGAWAYYRVRITASGAARISGVIQVRRQAATNNIILSSNPVESYLQFQYKAAARTGATLNIYNSTGALVLSQPLGLTEGSNLVTINLDGKITRGVYIMEVQSHQARQSVKFVKR